METFEKLLHMVKVLPESHDPFLPVYTEEVGEVIDAMEREMITQGRGVSAGPHPENFPKLEEFCKEHGFTLWHGYDDDTDIVITIATPVGTVYFN